MSPEAANTIRHAADVVQWFDLAVVVAILAVALDIGRRWPTARPYVLGPVTIAAHGVVFYIVILLWPLPGPVTSFWSALLRLHMYLIILSLLVAVLIVGLSPVPPGVGGYDDGDIDE